MIFSKFSEMIMWTKFYFIFKITSEPNMVQDYIFKMIQGQIHILLIPSPNILKVILNTSSKFRIELI